MAEFPALPIWTDSFIADTVHCSPEQVGVYIRMLIASWRTRACTLPDNDQRLAFIAGVSLKKWKSMRPFMAEFFIVENGEWSQKNLLKVRKKVRGLSKRGADAANARWNDNPLNNNDQEENKHESSICLPDASKTKTKLDEEEDDAGAGPSLRERILTAIGADPASGLMGPNGRQFGRKEDMVHVARWQSGLGLTDDEIVAVAGEVTARLKEPMMSFKLLERDMTRLAIAKTAPPIELPDPPPPIQIQPGGLQDAARREPAGREGRYGAERLNRIIARAIGDGQR